MLEIMSENVNDVRIWKSRKKMEKVNNCKKCQNLEIQEENGKSK
jgi:hypothetical protein